MSATEAAAGAGHGLIRLVEEIGRDRALTPADLSRSARTDPSQLRAAWALYERHWARFCGAHLDPQFWRFDHPARWAGLPVVPDGTPIVIVGTGPSLYRSIDTLRHVREHVHLFTSPRGAEALAEAGITPDLVLIEHQTALDAQFSVHARAQRRSDWCHGAAVVATDARTPAALVQDVSSDRLIVIDPIPTWSLWPATAAAIALTSGARAVGLLGIDLGTLEHVDPREAPLRALLSLLAQDAAACVDLGRGAPKAGWVAGALSTFAGPAVRRPLAVTRVAWGLPQERLETSACAWHRLRPLAAEAAHALTAACRLRDGDQGADACASARDHLAALLDRGYDRTTRVDVQEGLGCAFFPRFWRTPPDLNLGPLIWRPLSLAAHELVHQHRALGEALRARGVIA